jgi:hypothetical protein
VYVWADGVFLQARMEDHGECMPVLIGATPEGKKEEAARHSHGTRPLHPAGGHAGAAG